MAELPRLHSLKKNLPAVVTLWVSLNRKRSSGNESLIVVIWMSPASTPSWSLNDPHSHVPAAIEGKSMNGEIVCGCEICHTQAAVGDGVRVDRIGERSSRV